MNVPKLRFKEFDGEWEKKKFEELVSYTKGFAFKSTEYIKTGYRIIRVSDLLQESINTKNEPICICPSTVKNYENYRINNGDILVTTVGSKPELISSAVGRTIYYKNNNEQYLNQNLVKLETYKQYDSYFVYLLTKTKKYTNHIENIQRGNANQSNITIKELLEFVSYTPVLPEQKRISNFLELINKKIQLLQQKLDFLQEQKKFFLQKMIPKKGESLPEIRFKEFTGDWKQRKLGEIGKTQSGIGFPDVEQGGSKGVPFFKVSDMNIAGNEYEMITSKNYVSDEQLKRKKWRPIETVPAVIFAKVGAAIMLNRKRLVRTPFLMDNNTMAYVFDESWDTDFGKILFETVNLPKYAQVGALPSYNSSDIESIEVKVTNKEEQVKIGLFFNQLERLINLHKHKLALLEKQKKGFMQQMFI